MSTKVRLQHEFFNDDFRLLAIHRAGDDPRQGYVMKLAFEPFEQHSAFDTTEGARPLNGPPIRELVQAIMDEAWDSGFRPSGYGDLKESTAAVREHLTDMRAIAFHKLGMGPR